MSQANVTRRNFITSTAVGAAGLALGTAVSATPKLPMRIGMTDWNLQARGDIRAFERAHLIGLDGIEASLNTENDLMYLRGSRMQEQYREESYKWGVDIPSIAIGLLNQVPLKSEPIAAIWVADAIIAARNLGARNVLLAFFGKGDTKGATPEEMDRIIMVLRDLAPRAEDAGVVLGLENTLSARENMKIMEQVKSPALKVYYDFFNSKGNGYDVVEEIRYLGKENICQVHLKNGNNYMEQIDTVDWTAVSKALQDIQYDGWYVLETRSPSKDLIADTKKNVEYVKRMFTVG